MHATIDIGNKNVLIIGNPASGKTHLAKQLAKDNPSHELIHTDDYIKYGYKESLYVLLSHLSTRKRPSIIEGVLGYRLLRKGVEEDSYYPDMVIEVVTPIATRAAEYAKNRKGKDFWAAQGMCKANETILSDYKRMRNPHPPEWHTLKNNYIP